ncbi:MAG: hypothetical protein K0S70_132 [Microbacterium sp.]|jgi:hypothetical protein|nr:hypothetical protein [Microbacterium sp.]
MSRGPERTDYERDHGEPDPDFADVDEAAELRAAARGKALVINASDIKPGMNFRPASEGIGVDLQALSIYDDRLLDMASKRMSFEQMYDDLGCPDGTSPAAIGTRVRTLLAAYTLDAVEQKSLLLRDLVRLRDIIFDELESDGIHVGADGEITAKELSPAWASAMVRLLKEWRSTIESMQDDLADSRQSIREAHAHIMLQAITIMFERFVARLEEANADEFSGITFTGTRPAMMALLGEVMPLGFQHLQENVDEREKRVRRSD